MLEQLSSNFSANCELSRSSTGHVEIGKAFWPNTSGDISQNVVAIAAPCILVVEYKPVN